MSGNIPLTEPLKNLTGKVVKMEEKPRGFYAVLEFEEWIIEIKIDNERTFKIRYKENFSMESK